MFSEPLIIKQKTKVNSIIFQVVEFNESSKNNVAQAEQMQLTLNQ